MLHSFYCTSSVRLIKNSFHVGSAPSRLTLMPLLSPPRTSRLQTTTAVTASTELLLVAMKATASARFCDVRPPFRRMEHAAVKCTSFYSFSSKGRTRALFFGTSAGRLITHVSAVKNNLIRQALNRMKLNTPRQDWCSRDKRRSHRFRPAPPFCCQACPDHRSFVSRKSKRGLQNILYG